MAHKSPGISIAISPVSVADTLHVDVKLFGNTCSFLVDTGAAVSLISLDVWKQLCTSYVGAFSQAAVG